ncbi:unnamed protein product [Phaedon cochleariae]|uniref:Uncharacterized protein n=1 Tax=Phaedon cochleariae TaxID=80249 RepID=A0A9P0GHE3_PHACE|nr:unnamed protein product [Phaedon cochleariae]
MQASPIIMPHVPILLTLLVTVSNLGTLNSSSSFEFSFHFGTILSVVHRQQNITVFDYRISRFFHLVFTHVEIMGAAVNHIFLGGILSDSDSDSSETLSSTTSSSSEEQMDHSLNAIIIVNKIRGPVERIPRIENYIGNVILHYTPDIFRQHFRVFPDTFHFLVGCLRKKIGHSDGPGRFQIPLEHQILFALWYMATPDSYRKGYWFSYNQKSSE